MGVITKKNRKGETIYGIQWFEDGERQRNYSVDWGKEDAMAAFLEMRGKTSQGIAGKSDVKMTALYDDFVEQRVDVYLSRATKDGYDISWRLRIEPALGRRRVDSVTSEVVQAMVGQLKKKQHSPRSINKALTCLSAMMEYARKTRKIIAANPCHGVERLAETPMEETVRIWEPAEVVRVAEAALMHHVDLHPFQRKQRGEWAGHRDYTMILFALMTGLRQSELIALKWDRVDGRILTVNMSMDRTLLTPKRTKSARGRRKVWLNDEAVKLLKDWKRKAPSSGHIFPGSDLKPLRASHWYNKVWTPARTTAEVEGMRFHDLRHTFISRCLMAGRDLWEVATWAGDHPETIKKVYARYIQGLMQDTSRLNEVFTLQSPARPPSARKGAKGKPSLKLVG